MNKRKLEELKKWAEENGVSFDNLVKELDRLEEKGELGLAHLKKHMTSKLANQEDARTLFRMFAQELTFSETSLADTDEYIEVFPNLGETDISKLRRNFRDMEITSNRLQKRNVMLAPELWHTLVENPKELLSGRVMKKSVDLSRGQILFSQVFALGNLARLDSTIEHRQDCDAFILRTIQMDFLNTSEDYESKKIKSFDKVDLERYSKQYDDFILSADGKMFNEIYEIAERCIDFSIHEYYLPYGLTPEGLEKAVLLMRYDHCNDKHKNSNLPKYYTTVYQESLEEPHFHFNEGFGQIYKLLTKRGKGNFGAGFAIGLPALNAYFQKLERLEEMPAPSRKFWSNNDFGMPFLKVASQDRVPLCEYVTEEEMEEATVITELADAARDMYIMNFLGESGAELQRAFDFFNIVDGVEPQNLETYEIFTDFERNREDDNSRNR